VFRYAVTYTNDTTVLQNTRAIIHSVLTTESFTASNGYSCAVEYSPSTCGAVGPEPPGAWVNESTCVGNTSRLAFQWTMPPSMDIDLYYAVGHQHIGAVGIALLTAPPGSSNFTQLCDSLPRYGDHGFVVSMSACNFRDAPRRLPGGTTMRVVSRYHAAAEPLKEAALQLPWQGVMGYMNIEYTLAPASKFGVITATGAQERPDAKPVVAAPGPAVAPSAPVCLASTLSFGASRLTAASVATGTLAGAARSVVLTTSPELFTMEWTIDPSRCAGATLRSDTSILLSDACQQRRGGHHTCTECNWCVVRYRHPLSWRRRRHGRRRHGCCAACTGGRHGAGGILGGRVRAPDAQG